MFYLSPPNSTNSISNFSRVFNLRATLDKRKFKFSSIIFIMYKYNNAVKAGGIKGRGSGNCCMYASLLINTGS